MIQKCYHLTWYRIVDQFRTFFLFFASLFQCTFFNPFCILKYIIICKGCKGASDKQCILITIGLILLTCVTVGMKTNILITSLLSLWNITFDNISLEALFINSTIPQNIIQSSNQAHLKSSYISRRKLCVTRMNRKEWPFFVA